MNAIGYAHFQLNGGTSRAIRWTLGFAILGAATLAVWVRLNGGGGLGAAASLSRVPLTIALGVLLIIQANIRIGSALKRDAVLDMSRSHRLMPQSAANAVLGYIIGPNLSLLGAAVSAVLLGVVCIVGGGGDPTPWLFVVLILAVFAAMTWCLTAASSLASSGKSDAGKRGNVGWLAWALIGPMLGTGGSIMGVLPFLAVLVGPVIGPTVFQLRRVDQISWAHAASGALQAVVAAVFFGAACRRYRRDDVPGLSPVHWLVLAGTVTIGTLLGINYFETFRPEFLTHVETEPRVAIPAGMTLFLLMIGAPLGASEAAQASWRYRVNAGDPLQPESRPKLLTGGVLVAFLAFAVPLAIVPVADGEWPDPERQQLWAASVALGGSSLVCGALMVWGVVRVNVKLDPKRGLGWILFVAWGLPLLGAGFWSFQVYGSFEDFFNPLVSASPVGGIWAAWMVLPEPPNGEGYAVASYLPGTAFQALLAAGALIAAWRVPDRAATPAERD